MKIVPAIVLLLWVVCFGRCLAEQYGGLATTENRCCSGEKSPCPEQAPEIPCQACEFVQHGGVLLGDSTILDAPSLFCIPAFQFELFAATEDLAEGETASQVAVDTGPAEGRRLCEWMASTAMPVRGPTGRA